MFWLPWGQGYVLPGTNTVDHRTQELRAQAVLYPPYERSVIAVPSRRVNRG